MPIPPSPVSAQPRTAAELAYLLRPTTAQPAMIDRARHLQTLQSRGATVKLQLTEADHKAWLEFSRPGYFDRLNRPRRAA